MQTRFTIHRIAFLGWAATAAVAAPPESSGIDVRSTGYFMTDGGYINETQDVTLRKWTSEYYTSLTGGLRLRTRPSPHFEMVVNPELKSHNIFPIRPGVQNGQISQRTRYELYLEEARGSWFFGDPDAPRGRLDFGYLMHTDNPDAKVLGNYLMRSMVYPAILFSKMDNPAAYLFGLHGSMGFLDGALRTDAFVTSEIQHYPFFDLSAAASAAYSFRNLAEVGLGVHAKSLVPVRPSRTTPRGGPGTGLPENTYKFIPFQEGTPIKDSTGATLRTVSIREHAHPDSAEVHIVPAVGDPYSTIVKRKGNGIAGMATGVLQNKAMSDLATNAGEGDLYPELRGTQTKYTFAGTILNARVSVNPMGALGGDNFLGRDAFKLYAEAAVLGWSNYEGFYEKRRERIPVMAGVYLPTFNFLDFLAFEIEHFPNKGVPSFDMRAHKNVPQPGTHKGEVETQWTEERGAKDDWKWIVAGKRTFGGWGVAVQAGTDHMRLIDDGDNEFTAVMSRPSQWYTQVRFFAGIY